MEYTKIKDLKKRYSPEEIEYLWKAYNNNRTVVNRNKLIEHYLYLIYKPVEDMYSICGNTQEKADIFQSAVIGLIEAVEFYSKDKNAKFKTFSRWRIHGSIIDYLRKSSLINLPYKVRKNLIEKRKSLENTDMGFENPYNIISLDALYENNDARISDQSLTADLSRQPEIILEEKWLVEEVYRILKTLPADEYKTVIHYYFLDKTLDEIAKLFNMSRSGVWQMRERAVGRFRLALAEIH